MRFSGLLGRKSLFFGVNLPLWSVIAERGYWTLLIQDSEDSPVLLVKPLALMARAMPDSFCIKALILEMARFAKHNQYRLYFTLEPPCWCWYKTDFYLSFIPISPSFLTIFLSTNLELISSPMMLAASAKTNVILKYPRDWAFFASENKTQRLKL